MLWTKRKQSGRLLVYTRVPDGEGYTPYLANSVHLAFSRDGGETYEPLNRNYGIVFPEATVRETNALNEKGVAAPWIFRTADGGFGIAGVRVNFDGTPDEESRGRIVLWTSDDLVHFREVGLLRLSDDAMIRKVQVVWDILSKDYTVSWADENGKAFIGKLKDLNDGSTVSVLFDSFSSEDLFPDDSEAEKGVEDALPGNSISIDAAFGERLLLRWSPLRSVAVRAPEEIAASSEKELAEVKATVFYTDGSTHQKRVEWDAEKVDFDTPGRYEITGTAVQKAFPFPLAGGYADPDVMRLDGKYCYLATNDNENFIGLYMRKADTVDGLFAEGYRETKILDRDEARGFLQTFWAPEFHCIGGELYILFAVSGEKWGPQCHMMKLREGCRDRLDDPQSWETPKRVVRQDGRPIAGEDEDISLDMTHFNVLGVDYLVWSYRHKTGTPDDSGSMLYIATTDPERPWRLTSEPVLLSRPLYGWENNRRTINNEGPYAVVTDRKVFLSYSGGAAGGYSYVIGMLTADAGADLLDPASWVKENAPVLAYPFAKEFGAGHNAFYEDENGDLMLTFHAEEDYIIDGGLRCTGIRRIHFDAHGVPRFDMEPERDLDPALARVKTTVIVP